MNLMTMRALKMKNGLLMMAMLSGGFLLAPSIALADEDTAPKAKLSGASVKLCLACHGEGRVKPVPGILQTKHAVVSDPNSPFGEGANNCETCHGSLKAHMGRKVDGVKPKPEFLFDESTTAEEKNAVCSSCHDSQHMFHWAGSTHEFEGVACVDCHDIHQAEDAVRSLETQSEVCFSCHKEQRSLFLRQSRHPVQTSSTAMSHTGLMSCSDCHSPHGSSGPSQLNRPTVNQSCYDCHAEKRGPFLWEHQPVTEDCTNCHVPHGSNYENLLQNRGPWLCQRCHAAGFHPSTAYSGTGIPPLGAAQQVLGSNCLNCHSQIHGSNHPSGIRLTR